MHRNHLPLRPRIVGMPSLPLKYSPLRLSFEGSPFPSIKARRRVGRRLEAATHKASRSAERRLNEAAGAVWISSQSDGRISGGEKVHLLGEGFSEGQDLLVSAKLFNPYTLECILPPSDSARCVPITLHWQDRQTRRIT